MSTCKKEITQRRVAIIARDGSVQYQRFHTQHESAPVAQPEGKEGQVIFPFRETRVHSNAWRASDHVTFVKRAQDDA